MFRARFLFAIFFLVLSISLFSGGSVLSELYAKEDAGKKVVQKENKEKSRKENPLAPVKTDNPRDTMRTFMDAMNDYKKGVELKDESLIDRIDDATRTLNLEDTPYILRKEKGRESAIFLKEVIDRMIVINYDYIPEKSENPEKPLLRWRLKNSEIIISLVQKGDRAGEYLFSPDTAYRAKEFYEKVRHLPYKEGSGGGAHYKKPWLERMVPEWSKKQVLTLNLWQWGGIFFAILLGFIIKGVVRYAVNLLNKFASRSGTNWDNKLIKAGANPLAYVGATGFWFISLHVLRLEGTTLTILSTVIQIVLSVVVIWLLYRLSGVLGEYLEHLAELTESTLDDQLVPLINKTIKIFIVILGVLIAIQNLGINVMSVLAGLGIGGLAFALAAKDTVANLFGSIMILMDRPFQVGDWIKIPGAEGTVDEIGFRSTRIRTFYNSLVSVPNSEIANQKIDNMGLREYRRILTYVGVTYDTPTEKLEAFMEGIKNIIKANPNTRKDYFHVVFNRFGPSSLDIMLYFFFRVPDWSTELVETQNVFLEIVRLAEKIGVDFAFPTQSLHIETMPEKEPVRKPHDINQKNLSNTAKQFGPDGKEARPSGSGLFVPPFLDPDLK